MLWKRFKCPEYYETNCWNALSHRTMLYLKEISQFSVFRVWISDFVESAKDFVIQTIKFQDESFMWSFKLKIKNWISELTIYLLVPLITFSKEKSKILQMKGSTFLWRICFQKFLIKNLLETQTLHKDVPSCSIVIFIETLHFLKSIE